MSRRRGVEVECQKGNGREGRNGRVEEGGVRERKGKYYVRKRMEGRNRGVDEEEGVRERKMHLYVRKGMEELGKERMEVEI